jgi:hypothetical protein
MEPGCPFPVGPRCLVASDGYGNAVSPARANGQCAYCRGEDECVIEGCSNIAQRGELCRPCAAKRAPGQLAYQGDWWTLRDLVVGVMRSVEMRGVKFGVEIVSGEKRIVGRDGTFVIVFNRSLWAPLPTNPEAT